MIKRFAYILICCLVILSCIGCKANEGVTLTITYDGCVIFTEEYDISFATKSKVFFKHNNNYREYFDSFSNIDDALNSIDENIPVVLDKIENDYYVAPINAECYFDNGAFQYSNEVKGSKIDRASLATAILNNFSNTIIVEAHTKSVSPQTTVYDLKQQTVLLSEFSTSFATSAEGRANNICLASESINNNVIPAGARFSFNEVVGARNKSNGYSTAITIENGEFIEGIGGGVCQVSTTLYNAMLLAGCDVISVSHHSLPISYVQPSFDAMVSEFSDLIFENNSDYPIYIHSSTQEQQCYFAVYGYPKYKDCTPILRSEVLNTIPSNSYIDIVDDTQLATNEYEKIIKYPVDGLVSEGYIDLYRDGEIIDSYKIRHDTYKPQSGKRIIRNTPEELIGDQDVLQLS